MSLRTIVTSTLVVMCFLLGSSGQALAGDLTVTVKLVGGEFSFQPKGPWSQGPGDKLTIKNRTGVANMKLLVTSRNGGAAFASIEIMDGQKAVIVQGEGGEFAEEWEFCHVVPKGGRAAATTCAIIKQGISVPSLSSYGLVVLVVFLAGTALWLTRRRRLATTA